GDVQGLGRGRGIPEQLAHALGSLDEEPARLLAGSTTPQRRDLADPFATRAAEQRRAAGGGHGLGRRRSAEPQAASAAGTLALASSTSATKAASSLTASSASMRRSTSTPAAFRPWMNRL